MDSDSAAGLALLVAALVIFAFVVMAEAGVVAGFHAHMQAAADKELSWLEILRRYSRERQATLSALALARTLTLVAITAIVVFLVLEAAGRSWGVVTIAAFATVFGLMLFQALPRLLVSRDPEGWSAVLHPFVRLVRLLFGPPARLIDLPLTVAVRLWRARRPDTAEADEVLRLALLEAGTGVLPDAEWQMIRGVIELERTTVKEIMVPRIDIVAVESDADFQEVARLMAERGYSRLPVYKDTIDNIVGVVHAKEVMRHLAKGTCPTTIGEIVRPAHFVPESKRVDELLAEMRKNKMSIAIVIDEYGGTAGLVTIEDLLEEIVGEIADEFDIEEEEVQRLTDSEAVVDARVSIDALNDLFGLEIEKNDFETVGGFIYDHLGKMPSVGDEVRVDGLRLRILSVLGRRIKKVQVIKETPPDADDNGAADPKDAD